MRSIVTKLYQRVTNISLAAVIALGGVSVALPSIIGDLAYAANTVTVCVSSCDYTSLQDAVDNAGSSGVVEVNSDISIAAQVNLSDSITVNGNGFTLSSPFEKTSNSNNSAIGIYGSGATINNLVIDGTGGTALHGITTYVAASVLLNGVTVSNMNRSGLVVNGSNVTVNNITTSGNGWHGINVDQGVGVVAPSVLTVNGASKHFEIVADIFIDDTTEDVTVNDTNSQYNSANLSGNNLAYFVKADAPDISSPTPEQYFSTTPIVNSWTPVTYTKGISNYQVEYIYDDGHSFPGAPYRTTTSTTRNHTPNPGEQGGVTIRVRAIDSLGLYGQWSDPVHYTYDATAPAAPTGGMPATTTTNNFYFTWNPVVDSGSPIVEYQYQTSQNPSEVGGVLQSGLWKNWINGSGGQQLLTTPSIRSTGAPDATWYWQVRAIDAAGNVGPWSSIWNTVIDTHVPTGLAHISPLNGVVVKTSGLTSIDWTDATDPSVPVSYYYESSHSPATNPDGSFVTHAYQSGALSSSTIPTPGTPEGIYYWHVRAVDGLSNSTGWTTPWMVTVDNTAPVVSIDSPTGSLFNNNVEVRGTVTDANLRHYWVQVKRNGSVVHNQTILSAGISNALLYTAILDGEYEVTLAARDTAGGGASTGNRSADVVKSFTIDSVDPIITVTGGDITLAEGDTYTEQGATWVDTVDGSGDVADIVGTVNVNTPGNYTITYTYTDAAGNVGTATRTVTVEPQPEVLGTTTTTSQTGSPTPITTGTGTGTGTVSSGEVRGDNTVATIANKDTAAEVLQAETVADNNDSDGNIFGLAWYWWVVILAGIAGLLWFLMSQRRQD